MKTLIQRRTNMNNPIVFNNPEFGEIRTVMIDNEPWFVGKDITNALGYEKGRNAIQKYVDEDDALKWGITDSLGREQETTIINESGLYSLIFSSKLESARKFKHWVTSEVLPSIRKNGVYGTSKFFATDPSVAVSVASLARVTERIMKNQGSTSYEVAQAYEIHCRQFGIQLPKDFVKLPSENQIVMIFGDFQEMER